MTTLSIPAETRRFPFATPLVIAVAMFMESLDSTVIATAIPAIAPNLGTTPLNLSMAVSIYLLSIAIFTPLSGWVADRFGARSVFAAAIAIFTFSSVLCGAADSLGMLIAARGLQGVGGAMMMPVARLIMGRTFSKRDFVTAMTYVTVPGLIGPAIGPLVGGAIATYASWRWIFYVNLPIGLIGIPLALRVIENFKDPDVPPLDIIGVVLTGLGLAGFVMGIENFGRGLLPDSIEAALFATAAISLLLYWRHAKRVAAPAIDYSLLRIPTFYASIVGGSVCRIGFGAMPFLLPLLFQLGFGRSPLESGALTFSMGIGAILMKMCAPPILRRFGFRTLLIGNTVAIAAITASFALFGVTSSITLFVGVIATYGFLRSLQFTCLSSLCFADLETRRMSQGTVITSVAQRISMSIGVALGATLLHLSMLNSGSSTPEPKAFASTFLVISAVTLASVWFFARLPHEAGGEMSGHRRRTASTQGWSIIRSP